jgi:formylglycine-generating enzyme
MGLALLPNCDSPCASVEVPGGDFLRGRGSEVCSDCVAGCPAAVQNASATACFDDSETPEKTVTISSFKLDRYLVTVGRMKKFVEAFGAWRLAGNPTMLAGANPANQETGYRTGWALNSTATGLQNFLGCTAGGTSTYTSGHDEYPVNCVNWMQAFAFCIWDGGRLPSEAEWEYAAAGGSENRLYPWGATAPDATRARYGATDALVPVGSYSAGAARWGHLDMAGLLWEWVFDVFDAAYYDDLNACINCSNWSITAGTRVLRGGMYNGTIASGTMRATRRHSYVADPANAPYFAGFRCAR